MPVICAIQGNCFGGGMQMALACDYRIATPDANLSIMEIKWGLIPDMSGTVTLSRLTRVDIATELTMTGRQFPATEGFEYGLISKLAQDPVAEAENWLWLLPVNHLMPLLPPNSSLRKRGRRIRGRPCAWNVGFKRDCWGVKPSDCDEKWFGGQRAEPKAFKTALLMLAR